jgi:UDP-N-acetylmuramate--alanine ligase
MLVNDLCKPSMTPKLESAKTIYFVGIGGIGMSGLARLLQADGKQVSGSDLAGSALMAALVSEGIPVSLHQDGSAVPVKCDLVIYSSAVPDSHSERQLARQRGIPELNYFSAVGEYMTQFDQAIAVSGTHGKSTTTALVGRLLEQARLDPTVLVGSLVPEFGGNVRRGGKSIFVVEGCEHNAHMLKLRPTAIVLTNIDADHLDYYKDLDAVIAAFQHYVDQLPAGGLLVVNADDPGCQRLELPATAQVTSYGIGGRATLQATDHQRLVGHQAFRVGTVPFQTTLPGLFNVYNTLAMIGLGRALGVPDVAQQQTAASFRGIWRRFERLGDYRGVPVISDYAHHPTAVEATIEAAREAFPGKRVVVVFQPHQRARTKALFDLFVGALATADFLILQEIYDVAGREEAGVVVSSRDLAAAIEERHQQFPIFTPDAAATQTAIDDTLDSNDILLIMGAGDIYRLAESLTKPS